jgi:amidase
VRAKQVAPTDLLEAAIERVERHNPALNAVVHEMYDAARRARDALPVSAPTQGRRCTASVP